MAETALDPMIAHSVEQARTAQYVVGAYTQQRVDDVVHAVGWACYQDEHARKLAVQSVQETNMGNAEHRVNKIRRKAMMMLRDLREAPSVGAISHDGTTGLTVLAKPVGVVAALCPTTHPATDLMAKAMMVLKGRNAIIVSPSPGTLRTSELTCAFIREELRQIGAPPDLVQLVEEPTKSRAAELVAEADSAVVTGSANNVRLASTSGTPTYAGGAGNVPIVVEASADLHKAASDIATSKTFDYATACSSESVLLIEESVYDDLLHRLAGHGGQLLSSLESAALAEAMWHGGRINPKSVGRSPAELAALAGLYCLKL